MANPNLEETELNASDLQNIYQKSKTMGNRINPVEPSEQFKLTLRHYQKQALGFMLSKETCGEVKEESQSLSPLWNNVYAFFNKSRVYF